MSKNLLEMIILISIILQPMKYTLEFIDLLDFALKHFKTKKQDTFAKTHLLARSEPNLA